MLLLPSRQHEVAFAPWQHYSFIDESEYGRNFVVEVATMDNSTFYGLMQYRKRILVSDDLEIVQMVGELLYETCIRFYFDFDETERADAYMNELVRIQCDVRDMRRKAEAEEAAKLPPEALCDEIEAWVGRGVMDAMEYTFRDREVIDPSGSCEIWRWQNDEKKVTIYALTHRDGKAFFATMDRDLIEVVRDEIHDSHLDVLVKTPQDADRIAHELIGKIRNARDILAGEDQRVCTVVLYGLGSGQTRFA